jgi:hypothetical protein
MFCILLFSLFAESLGCELLFFFLHDPEHHAAITQLLFQQNALVLLKEQILQFVLFVFVFLASTCFGLRRPSSGGAMPVPN